jgi:hypothetical protein
LKPSAISVVVADAGPLIALARLDRLGLLAELFQQVQVPRIVLAECGAHPALEDARRFWPMTGWHARSPPASGLS